MPQTLQIDAGGVRQRMLYSSALVDRYIEQELVSWSGYIPYFEEPLYLRISIFYVWIECRRTTHANYVAFLLPTEGCRTDQDAAFRRWIQEPTNALDGRVFIRLFDSEITCMTAQRDVQHGVRVGLYVNDLREPVHRSLAFDYPNTVGVDKSPRDSLYRRSHATDFKASNSVRP